MGNNISKVLVTGGAGYIGSHCCKKLAENQITPIVLDNLSRGNRQAIKWGDFFENDLKNYNSVSNVISKIKPHAVIHLAAFAYVEESIINPIDYYENNVIGSINLIKACILNNVKYFVFSSSCATYGNAITNPISETHPQNPINPYGHTKLFTEKLLQDLSNKNLINYISLKYFNASGASKDGDIGESHNPETHLIPLVLKTAKGDFECFKIYGSDYPTPDGTCVRDFIHVDDLAEAHILALNYLFSGQPSTSINLGSEKGYSIKKILDIAKRITRKDIKVIFSERREGDPPYLVGSNIKAKSILGWAPENSIENIIFDAWNWELNRLF